MILPEDCYNGEEFILSLHNNNEEQQNNRIHKYVKNSVPKISIPENNKCNHFQLIHYLKENDFIKPAHISRWTNNASLDNTLKTLKRDFVKLFTPKRIRIIEKILNLRFQKLGSIIK